MKHIKSGFIIIIMLLLWASPIHLYAQLVPTPEQVQQIKEKLDKIKELKNQGKKDSAQEIRDLAKDAIKLADSFYKIPPANSDGEPEYDPDVSGDGESSKSGKKVKVKIGPEGLSSPGWLASTKSHEIEGHGGQAADSPTRWYTDAKGSEINEVEAYDLELKKAGENGLTQAEIDELKKRRKEHYDALDSANRAKLDSQKAAGKPYTLALATSTGAAVITLGGMFATLYAPSMVLADERMLVTLIQKDPVANLMVTATANGKTTSARTDAYGRALLDISAISTGLPDNSMATLTCMDANGRRLASANTVVRQGNSWIFDPPIVNDMPSRLTGGSVLTIHGKNLGADAKLICGRMVQETLSASDNEMTVFIDAQGGPQPVFIVTSYGVSSSRVAIVEPRIQVFQQHVNNTFTTSGQQQTTQITGQTVSAVAGGSFRK